MSGVVGAGQQYGTNNMQSLQREYTARGVVCVIGHLYGARNTPQLIVIDPQGILRYDGAIDDKPTTDPADVPRAKNYLRAALDAGMAGKTIAIPMTQPYGCTVQY